MSKLEINVKLLTLSVEIILAKISILVQPFILFSLFHLKRSS